MFSKLIASLFLFCLFALATAQWGHKDPMRASTDFKIADGAAYPYGPQRYWPGFQQDARYHKKQEPLPGKKRD